MKQIVILTFVGLLSISCNVAPVPYTGDDGKKETTLEVLEKIDSSLQVAVVGYEVFILDTTNVVVHKGIITSNNDLMDIPAGVFVFVVLCSFSLGVLVSLLGS